MDRKMNILIKKKILRSTNYKLLAEIQLNLINNWVFFLKFVISAMGGNCDYSSQTTESLATPLQLQCTKLPFETV